MLSSNERKDVRVVLLQIDVFGLIVLTNQVQNNVGIANAITNRLLITRMEGNHVHFTHITRLFQMADFITLASVRNHTGHTTRGYEWTLTHFTNPTHKQHYDREIRWMHQRSSPSEGSETFFLRDRQFQASCPKRWNAILQFITPIIYSKHAICRLANNSLKHSWQFLRIRSF